jgi:small-conductance mechanosensitive channel
VVARRGARPRTEPAARFAGLGKESPVPWGYAIVALLQHALLDVVGWVPGWLIGTIILIAAAGAALLVHALFGRLIYPLAGRISPFLTALLARSRWPAGVVLVVIGMSAALPASEFTPTTVAVLGHGLVIALVLALGWATINAANLATERYLSRVRFDVPDNLLARKHVTQVRILRGAAQTLIVLVTISSALMTIDAVRQYGLSLFASAGAAGLVVGLAARPVLSNLLAGIQIAMTQPIRVEDSVVVEGEWGWIENIAATYVVIRLWDWRRMIVPLSYFIEKPFQNWTFERGDLIGSVFLHVDYTVPVERVRAKLHEIAAASPLWDRQVVNLQVTGTPGAMVELRALVSARSAPEAWDLRCHVREQLIQFLQAEYPHGLPRQRAELTAEGLTIRTEPREAQRKRA